MVQVRIPVERQRGQWMCTEALMVRIYGNDSLEEQRILETIKCGGFVPKSEQHLYTESVYLDNYPTNIMGGKI